MAETDARVTKERAVDTPPPSRAKSSTAAAPAVTPTPVKRPVEPTGGTTPIAKPKPEAVPADSQKKRPKPSREARPTTPCYCLELPEPEPDGTHDLGAPQYYLNRELTWLNFNFRILNEAEDPRTPLLERVKFIAIVSSNLDEFFMKRIGGLKQQVGAGLQNRTLDGRTPREQLEDCYVHVRELERRKRTVLLSLIDELRQHGVTLTTWTELTKAQQRQVRAHFHENVYPLLTPQATDPAHPFPFISNLSLNLLVSLHHSENPTPQLARVKLPIAEWSPRLLRVGDTQTFVQLESVIAHNLDLLFPGMQIDGWAAFRVTRNANTERDEERADDLLAMIETELRDRKFAPVVRLEVADDMAPLHRGMLAAELGLDERDDVFEVEGMIGMSDLMELTQLADPALHDPPHHPADHALLDSNRPIFHTIREAGSILLHHPYESFTNSVERFLREASRDPKVRAIKMSLYRTSSESKVIEYLVEAARNGKQVAVVLELKARFDEEANIRWANRMGEVGIHVTYGVVGLKTHCKVILVVRQDYTGIKRYAHIGTGNYHAGTARLYSDLGLLTSDDTIGDDLTELFNYLTTGYKPKRRYKKVLPAPKVLKPALLAKIDREIEKHTNKNPGLIQLKMNALEDADVTRALYRAGLAGVHVDLIVRDTCRLRPGIPGLSDKVRVISIVGRFLEHARLYYFKNGGKDEYLLGSADIMSRNLESRVELVVPVEEPALKDQLRSILDTQLADRRSAWEMRHDGSYEHRQSESGEPADGAQQAFITWAEKRLKDSMKLRRRRPRGPRRAGARSDG